MRSRLLPRAVAVVVAVVVVGALSAVEHVLLERLLFRLPGSLDFVIESVRGILHGTPVYKAWQQRLLGPLVVAGLEALVRDPALALAIVRAATLLAANLLLYALLRRRGVRAPSAIAAVAVFAAARIITVYRLEYPWDGIDAVLFVAAGDWAARDGRLRALAPLLAIGLINHETVLYLPLFALLAPLERGSRHARRELAWAAGVTVLLGVLIVVLRHALYRGAPSLPGQTFEPITPLISNPLHVAHNARALFVWNWQPNGHPAVSVGFLVVAALLVWLATRAATRRIAVWSLCVLATIVCFGFVNETRLYLPLYAFLIAARWR